jgi:plasmid maintenance system antidote protein VapI
MGVKYGEAYEQVGIHADKLRAIIEGRSGITESDAEKLAASCQTTAAFWLNLQRRFNSDTADRYTRIIRWSDADQSFVGECMEFPGISSWAINSGSALAKLAVEVEYAVAGMQERGEPLPPRAVL